MTLASAARHCGGGRFPLVGGGGSPSEVPQPDVVGSAGMRINGGRNLFDTRPGAVENGLVTGAKGGDGQNTTNISEWDALYWDSWPPESGSSSRSWVSLDGVIAARRKYRQYTDCGTNDEQDHGNRIYPVDSTAKIIVLQLELFWGRHPDDPDTHGTLGEFFHKNFECVSADSGRKILACGRGTTGTGASSARLDILAPGNPGGDPETEFRAIINGSDLGSGTSWSSGIDPSIYNNQWNTLTLLVGAESTDNAGDGQIKLWMNEDPILNVTGVHIGSAHWQASDRGIEFTSVMNRPQRDQVEYWRNAVVFLPAA